MQNSSDSLPKFKYFEDPYSDGYQRQFEESDGVCACCRQVRGYRYMQSPYGKHVDGEICPWCIADGSAAAKLGVEFVDAASCRDEVTTGEDELAQRTPAFVSWQGEAWRAHCGEPCCFVGDGSPAKVRELQDEISDVLDEIAEFQELTREQVIDMVHPPGPFNIYLFRCVRCGTHCASWDTD
ncbi:MAG: CbrC family protein [Planctomycetota bacterium]